MQALLPRNEGGEAPQVFVGAALSYAAARLLTQFFPLVDLSDWGTFVFVAAGLVVLALWACYLPAWRVNRMPVTNALRQE